MNIKTYFVPIMILILLSACAVRREQTQPPSINNDSDVSLTPTITTSTIQPSADIPVTNTPVPLPTATLLATDIPKSPTWEKVDHWTPANQIRTMLIDRSGNLWTGGPASLVHWNSDTGKPTIYTIRGEPENTNVIALSQTPDGAIWVSTFGNGLARFDGTNWQAFTTEDGLPSNYIISQTITSRGELWFTTQKDRYSQEGNFGRLSGNKWITENGGAFDHIVALPDGSIVGTYNFPYTSGFFPSTIGIYDGQMWSQLAYFPYEYIDAITVAPDGIAWIATDDHIFRLVGRTLHKVNPSWAGKDFPRVSSISVSGDGVAWFGFSRNVVFDMDPCGDGLDFSEEHGVYRYDGSAWTQFTTEDGLVDNKICAITVDSSGNAWFGSFDKGVSRFDGHEWKTYAIP